MGAHILLTAQLICCQLTLERFVAADAAALSIAKTMCNMYPGMCCLSIFMVCIWTCGGSGKGCDEGCSSTKRTDEQIDLMSMTLRLDTA